MFYFVVPMLFESYIGLEIVISRFCVNRYVLQPLNSLSCD